MICNSMYNNNTMDAYNYNMLFTAASYEDECSESDIQLISGRLQDEGKVVLCFNGLWNTVCLDEHDYSKARLVCRQLGYDGCGFFCAVQFFIVVLFLQYLSQFQLMVTRYSYSLLCYGRTNTLNECRRELYYGSSCGRDREMLKKNLCIITRITTERQK